LPQSDHVVLPEAAQGLTYVVIVDHPRPDYALDEFAAALVHLYRFYGKPSSFGEIEELAWAWSYLKDSSFSRETLNRLDLEALPLSPTLKVVRREWE